MPRIFVPGSVAVVDDIWQTQAAPMGEIQIEAFLKR
jgi:hypothetical protein